MLSGKNAALSRLELVINELEGIGLGGAIFRFFDAAENLASQPEDATARRLFVSAAQTLTDTFRDQDQAIRDLRTDLNNQVENIGLPLLLSSQGRPTRANRSKS